MTPPPPTTIEPCPNPECGHACEIIDLSRRGMGFVKCTQRCGYCGPIAIKAEAIRLHNLLCRSTPQPTPEAAEPDAWLIYYDDPDKHPEVFMGKGAGAVALKRFDEVLLNWSAHLFATVAAHPPKPEPTEADADDWRDKCWDAAQAAMAKWTGLTEQHRHEIARDVVDAFLPLAPATQAPKPTEEWMEAAKEICEFAKLPPGFASAHDVHIASIISKHYTAPAEGWQWVPKEPTENMEFAFHNPRTIGKNTFIVRYKSMLAAAPKAGK